MGLLTTFWLPAGCACIGVAIGWMAGYLVANREIIRLHKSTTEYISELLARSQTWGVRRSEVSEDGVNPPKAGEVVGGEKPKPWLDDPQYAWCDVVLEPERGLVHITTDEDAYEEDIHLFLRKYNLGINDI